MGRRSAGNSNTGVEGYGDPHGSDGVYAPRRMREEPAPPKSKISRRNILFGTGSVAVLGLAAWMGINAFSSNTVVKENPAPTVDGPMPEYKGVVDKEGKVEGAEPTKLGPIGPWELRIPANAFVGQNSGVEVDPNGVNMKIVPVKLDKETEQMNIPETSLVGWYDGSNPVGADNGSTVMLSHVDFPDGRWGQFAALSFVSKGAPIEVTGEDGKPVTYVVEKVETIKQKALPSELFTKEDVPRLVLITCGGGIETLDDGTRGYAHNTVVTAVRADQQGTPPW